MRSILYPIVGFGIIAGGVFYAMSGASLDLKFLHAADAKSSSDGLLDIYNNKAGVVEFDTKSEQQRNRFDEILNQSSEILSALSREMTVSYEDAAQEIEEKYLRIKRIHVLHAFRVSREKILKSAGLSEGNWMFGAISDDLKARILSNPWIEKVSLTRKYAPFELTIEVTEHEPWLVAEYGGTSWLVSKAGTLISPLSALDDSNLVIESANLSRLDGLSAVQSAEERKEVSSNLEDIRFSFAVSQIKLFQSAGELPFEIERYSVIDNGVEFHPMDIESFPIIAARASSFSDAKLKIEKAQRVLEDLAARGERAQKIDLRFQSKIVVTPMDEGDK